MSDFALIVELVRRVVVDGDYSSSTVKFGAMDPG